MPYLIVGLGNPGKEYAATRHNFGFLAADALAERSGAVQVNVKQAAEAKKAEIGGKAVYILKPQTYMNLSGQAVAPFMRTKKISAEKLVAIHDDIDLPFGEVRVSRNASAGGHNGVKSLIETLGTKDFARIRVGIGRPADSRPVDEYVLGKFSATEKRELPAMIDNALEELEKILAK